MGQENSHEQIDSNTPTKTLSSRSLEAVAEYIKDGTPKKIVVMTGAGISTSAGIPDFRSPDTGLYANLARLDLPFAEAVFDISYFRQNPDPFYVLAKELYPGKFFPTVAHSFVALLEEKSMLQMLFTQNIDTLERRAGVPGDKIVEAHGSFATQRCIDCKSDFPDDLMRKAIENGKAPHCIVPQCNGLVKPDIVFFGEALPDSFFQNRGVPATADLLIVMGTSLSVHPFASLPQFAREGVPRVLINKEIVGDFGSRPDDVVILGDCDEGVRKLADALGWRDELEGMWLEVGGKVKEQEAARLREQRKAMSKDEVLEAEIEKLTRDVDASLQISKDHTQRVNDLLAGPAQPEGKGLKLEAADDSYPTSTRLAQASDVPGRMKDGVSEPPPTPNDNPSPDPIVTVPKGHSEKKPATSDDLSTLDLILLHNKPIDDEPIDDDEGTIPFPKF
ncbi:putative NAD-dependent deacetylase sirtuin-2 [Venustampulla echinocandica]|uniref:Putative NAD-dependent deacetylase sirtuin-2 n=1 Tax=Venustampulla echinocandica TaxID=2656787 RepID=A0A370TKC4_9HELO|nr:putative NAD-dependent deacetylase sirtuin-2 [Venustampulla echinocandica]RDL35982.1 putative NAD-dependent deacetylase sirtuin-2 [Venustampulla echinocandica]